MSSIWSHANKEHPCIVCGKDDWCTFGDRAMLCQRVASDRPSPKGGWYHFYDGSFDPTLALANKKEAPAAINAGGMMRKWRAETKDASFHILAEQLGVSYLSLIAIGAAYSVERSAWAFPMRDGYGETVGIRLRNIRGFKWAVSGSRGGIFLPEPSVHPQITAWLPEGPTDTAAVLTLGLFAIGRPNNQTGANDLRIALRRLGVRRVVVIADNDELKRLGPREGYPGLEGADKLRKELGMPSVIWQPPTPIKDVREFVSKGGTRTVMESAVNKKVWSRK